jgi:adenylate cyclase
MRDKIDPIADWLVDGARSAAEAHLVLGELCERLAAAGLPLWRVAVFVRTLHPHIMGRRFLWQPGADVVVAQAPFAMLQTEEFRRSPVAHVYATDATIRRCLADPDCAGDFEMLEELRRDGVTDYLATPLRFTNGEIHVASWTTRRPGGFTDAEIAGIEQIVAPLARVAEVRALRRVAGNLLNTYLGSRTGERIMSGQIQPGHCETIHAAIWLSDMRGFTSLADRVPGRDLIGLLNRYFDAQVPPILDRGGEVLKFMGDGLLAIFPLPEGTADAGPTCRAALEAARAARANVAALSGATGIVDLDEVRFGVALHLGDVLYGNVGGGSRLDFTCIGPAVNLAARIEKLTGKHGRTVLMSEEVARHCRDQTAALGEFALAGFSRPQTVYGLLDETS